MGDRLSPDLTLEVTEPSWLEVTVTAKIVSVSLEAANGLADRVSAALTAFLHPLTGGTKKRGWPFGRYPHKSDLYAFLERQPGVSYITSLEISPTESEIDENIKKEINQKTENEIEQEIKRKKDQLLIYSGRHSIIISS